jgi:hypothetical protein
MARNAEELRHLAALNQSPAGDLVRKLLVEAITRTTRRAVYGTTADERTMGAGGTQALEEVLSELRTAKHQLNQMENQT